MFVCIFSQNCINLFLDVLENLSSFSDFQLVKGSKRHYFVSEHFFMDELDFFFRLKIHFFVP